ncbi:hypothetical protein CANCADRAFT_82019 [Tortispora caseinolytica NRRL Y-17796]|uniref:Ubiquitin carboxyl-terminal hydrolase n=1 Tax=Tortispora caseinolytica NRRL Y-17796 TaxID=767744 RepID=A0A1E4TK82_9ASCO|nr:hypothetical protein CANCADRAFT_82019 [Tortispora caseinolytica NRRL Y-17796]
MSGWNTIESDAGILTEMIESLGVKGGQFHEVFSLDTQELIASGPLYGAIFLFKHQKDTHRQGIFDYESLETNSVWFAHQTIQNACATVAVLSLLMNSPHIDIGSELEEFRSFTIEFDPTLRGECLTNSNTIQTVHNSFSKPQLLVDEESQNKSAEDAFHYVAYLPINGKLYELDGLQEAPISHGECTETEFAEKLITVIQKRIQSYDLSELRFSLLPFIRDKRLSEDPEDIKEELARREVWRKDSIMRSFDYSPFIHELLKRVISADGPDDEAWNRKFEQARNSAFAKRRPPGF